MAESGRSPLTWGAPASPQERASASPSLTKDEAIRRSYHAVALRTTGKRQQEAATKIARAARRKWRVKWQAAKLANKDTEWGRGDVRDETAALTSNE